MRRKAVQIAAGVLAAIGLCATSAQAQGYSVYEHDACAMGRAGAGVASPCAGGSAIFFNPAGIVTGQAGKWNVAFGVTMIPPRGSWVPDGGTATDFAKNNIPVPNVYVTRQIGSRFAVGVGMFAPYGLTTEWPATSPGRFLSYKATIKGVYIQPTVAFRVNRRIQVGAGIDLVRTAADLNRRVDASSLPLSATMTFANLGIPVGTDFADMRMHGAGNAIGAHFGIIFRPTDALSLGARFMTGTTVEGAGYAAFTAVPTLIRLSAGQAAALGVPTNTPLDAVLAGQFAAGGKFGTQTMNATIPMPSQLVVGFDLRVMTGLHVMGDVQLTNWSAFEQLPLTLGAIGAQTLYEDYVNTVGFRAAVEYAVTPKLNVRGGFITHGAAAPDHTVTPLLPEAGRVAGIIGAGYQLNSGIRIDAAYQLLKQSDRRGRVVDWTPSSPPDVNTGVYKLSANLIGVGLSFAF
jgi:long-chain fatty acid transport protein